MRKLVGAEQVSGAGGQGGGGGRGQPGCGEGCWEVHTHTDLCTHTLAHVGAHTRGVGRLSHRPLFSASLGRAHTTMHTYTLTVTQA